MKARARAAMSLIVSLAVVLAPWPAWGQTARVAAPASGLSAPAANVSIIRPLPSAPASLLAPALGSLAAPSLESAGAPVPLELAAVPASQGPLLPAAAASPQPAAPLPAAVSAAPAPAPRTPDEAAVHGKTVVMVGTKISRPFILQEALRVANDLGLNLVLVDDPANRKNSLDSVPDSHFIAAPINTRDAKTMGRIVETVAAHPEASRANAVVGFMSLYANLTGRITDRLGVAGIPGKAVAAADDKPEARKILNAVPALEVPFREIKTEALARKAYNELSGGGKYRVVIKTIRGENSRFLALGISSEEAAAAQYIKMDAAVRDFVARPEAKQTTFSSHPGIMMERMLEKVPGTEETSVEVVMQNGKAAFAIVSDTRGIGAKSELAGGIMVFPSQQPAPEHAALIEAAEHALKALGIVDGNARLDMMTTPDGPRVIEINPFMGGVAIWQAVKSLTGMSLVEQGLRAVLGLPVDPGHAPDGVIHYIFLAASQDGTLEAIEGLEAARKLPGVELARVFVERGDSIVAALGNAYEEWAEIIGKGKTWREAIANAVAGAKLLSLRVRRPDATPVSIQRALISDANDRELAKFKSGVRARYSLGDADMHYVYNTDNGNGILTISFVERAAMERAALPKTFQRPDGTPVNVYSQLTPEAVEREIERFKDDVRIRYALDDAGMRYVYNSDGGNGILTISFADRAALSRAKIPSTLALPGGTPINVYKVLIAGAQLRELAEFKAAVRVRYGLGDAEMEYVHNSDSGNGIMHIAFVDRAAMERAAVPETLALPDGTRINVYQRLTRDAAKQEIERFKDNLRVRYALGDATMRYEYNSDRHHGKLYISFADRAAMEKSGIPKLLHLPNGTVVRLYGDYQQPTADDLAPLTVPNEAKPRIAAQAEPAPALYSKVVLGFLSTFLLVSTVVESTSLAVSQMTMPLTQGFLALAALTSISYAAYTLGSYLGGGIIKRLGIRLSYRLVLLARAAIWTALALLFNPATGTIALAALIPLFSLDYFFHSIGRVAEHSLQVAWFKNSEAASSRFGSYRDFIEYATVFIGSAMALVVAAFGFGAVIYPAPVAFGAAALLALALKLPKAASNAHMPSRWNDGFKTVFKDAGIYKPLFGFALVNSFLYMMYYIVATAFGAYHAPDPEHASAVAGSLTAVYGVGALIGAVVMDRLAARIEKKVSALPEAERKPAERSLYARSAARVLPWAAAALLGSWAFLSGASLGTLIWPMFPISLAMLAIGFTAQLASNHLDTIMKSNIPSDKKDVTVGAIRSLIYLTHVFGFLLWGGMFALFGPGAFALFAAFYTAVAGIYLWLARSLNK